MFLGQWGSATLHDMCAVVDDYLSTVKFVQRCDV